jgi:hypothetical protein
VTAHIGWEVSLGKYEKRTLTPNASVSKLKSWMKELTKEVNNPTTFCFGDIDFAFDIRRLVSFKTFVKAITRYHDMLMSQDVYF